MRHCKSCNDFRYIRLPELVWENDEAGNPTQARWIYRKVVCAACYVQVEMRL